MQDQLLLPSVYGIYSKLGSTGNVGLMLDIDKLQLGMNCLVCVILLVISGLHHIIPAQEYSMPYGTCVYTMKTDGQ